MSGFGHPKLDEFMAEAAGLLPAEEYATLAAHMKTPDMMERMLADLERPPRPRVFYAPHEELEEGLSLFERVGPATLARVSPEHTAEEWADRLAMGRDLIEDGIAVDPALEAHGDPVLRIIIKLNRAIVRKLRGDAGR